MHLGRLSGRPRPLLVTAAAAAVLFLAALTVMSAVAGWGAVGSQGHFRLSFWFAAAFAAETASFIAYVFAYRSVAAVEDGPKLSLREAAALVAFGFGAFLAKGGAALDSKALATSEGGDREGEVRVLALDALEHAPLAPAACAAALTLLAAGQRKPGLDFTIPWSTLVPLGAALAVVGVRHRARFVGRHGWRGKLGDVLEGIWILFRLAREWRRHWVAFAGAALYWAGDVLCLWAALHPFHAAPRFAPVVLAHAVGYVLTRRTLPLAGAGIVEVLMPLTLVAAGAPFAGAILGVFVYRLFNLWLPLIPAAAALPHLRRRYGRSFQALPHAA
ncbi:MAG TPA: lysylphosphatidylglycerol synthase domain-containing protein [Gaiellaceae bacterium]|nr:lysylphosphatidylglycerol synthase domain-containing protein [Gaiellaceae bacterium]